jgi:hypothetical protein
VLGLQGVFTRPRAAANGGITSWLQSSRLVAAVAELGSLSGVISMVIVFAILVLFTVVAALFLHTITRKYFLASLLATLLANLAWYFLRWKAYLIPHFNTDEVKILVICIVGGFAIAAIVGLPFVGIRRMLRSKRKNEDAA